MSLAAQQARAELPSPADGAGEPTWMPGAAALGEETPCSITQEEKLQDLGFSEQ